MRGSTGYGKTFSLLDNGFKRDDTYKDINALFDWIATRPDLDADRIAVTGGSYGGHMTLAVSTFYSDRIRCSVDIVGMSNLVTFLEHTEAYRRDLRRVEYGDERDPKMREFLEKIAPMNNIEKIKKPMFVIAGKNDPRVPVSESQQIADALKKQGTPVWLLIAKDEGHGYRKKVESRFSVLCDGGVFAGVLTEVGRSEHWPQWREDQGGSLALAVDCSRFAQMSKANRRG